jgi:hypothetical protein
MLCIKYIVFACYPPRSDTSHEGGLVDLSESQKLHVLLIIPTKWFIVIFQGGALKETRE